MRKLISLIVCLVMGLTIMMAQNKYVQGTVISSEDGHPVIGATVRVSGTTTGTTTNYDGEFYLEVPEGKTLSVSYIGMTTEEVTIKGSKKLRVVLDSDSKILEDVVVTAMGIKKSEKAVGYAATTMKASEIKEVPMPNVTEALAGKIAGVNVASTSTEPGAATSITIRGFSSLTGSNEPLWVVDGVPIQNNSVSSAYGDDTRGAGVANLNQDDIESMTILKGAAATALYGSRAANGVILVTTKSGNGTSDRNFEIEVNGGMQWSSIANLPQMQNKYGQGWDGNRTLDENGSWGPEMDGTDRVYGAIYNNSQLLQKFEAVKDNVKNFFDTGISYNTGVSVSGHNNGTTYYLSYSRVGDDGIMPGDKDTFVRNTYSMRGTHTCTDWLKFSSSVNLATSKTNSVPTYQGTSVIDGLYEMPRNISIADLADLSSPFNTPAAYYTEYGITNPYWCLENNYEELNQKKVYGKMQVDINPIKELTITYRFGFDYSDYDSKAGIAKITDDNASTSGDNKQDGNVYAYYQRRYELNHDFMANYSKKFGDFDLGVTIGANMNERYLTSMSVEGTDLTIKTGWWDLANAGSYTTSETQNKRRSVGALGDIQLGYKDIVFMGITGRNDWSSTLPKGNNNFFYPGVTASWIFSENLSDGIKEYLEYGKLRAAIGKTGNDADAYKTNNTYVSGFANTYYSSEAIKFPMGNGTNAFKTSATLGSNELKPEMTTEWELGTELRFLHSRVGIDFAYYDRTTDDQIMTLNADPSCGYSYIVTNFGSISNHGIELMVDVTPVQTKNWKWDLSVNWNKNWNKVEELPASIGGEYAITSFSTSSSAVYMKAVEGKELGQLYTYLPQYADANNNLKFNEDGSINDAYNSKTGKIVVDSKGIPVMTKDVVATGKSTQNKWSGGISSSLSYKGITLAANFDIRYGGYMFSRTKDLMSFTGNGISTIYNDRQAFIIPNSVSANENGEYVENTVALSTYDDGIQSWIDGGYNEGGESLLIDRTFIKLRTLSLAYNLPKKWLATCQLQNVRLSFVASNLFTWTPASNCYIDPDVSSFGTGLKGQFGELYSNPTCRKFGFNVQVKF